MRSHQWPFCVLCFGLCGIAYFSSVEMKREGCVNINEEMQQVKKDSVVVLGDAAAIAGEKTPLVEKGGGAHHDNLDFETFPHSGTYPHSHETIDLHLPALPVSTSTSSSKGHTCRVSKYHIGLCMAVVNGVLAATIMVPLHYAPPNTTQGLGYSTSFGIAAVLIVMLFWIMRFLFLSLEIFIYHSLWAELCATGGLATSFQILLKIATGSLHDGYDQLPSFHLSVMWRPGLTSGLLYSLGNLFGIVSIQNLGDFMGYSLSQSSMIISGEVHYFSGYLFSLTAAHCDVFQRHFICN